MSFLYSLFACARSMKEKAMLKQQGLLPPVRFAAEISDPDLVLRLPYPPSVNHYWVYFSQGRGRRVTCTIGAPGSQAVANGVFMAGVRRPMEGRLSQ